MNKALSFAGTILTSLSIVLLAIGFLLLGQNARAQNPPPDCVSNYCVVCRFSHFNCADQGQELGRCNYGLCPGSCGCPYDNPLGNPDACGCISSDELPPN